MSRAVTWIAILSLLGAMLLESWVLAAPGLVFWLAVLYRWHRPILRRIYRPRLWLVSGLIALASGMFLGEPGTQGLWMGLSTSGLVAGLWMVMRCIALLTLASYLSSTLARGPLVAWLSRRGLSGLAEHVQVAVEALPAMQDRLVETWSRHRVAHKRFRDLPRVIDNAYYALLLQATAGARPSQAGLVVAVDGESLADSRLAVAVNIDPDESVSGGQTSARLAGKS
ncbi:MAG: hypothetical protein JW797_20225 [Bradymonadales bacterium]|nr:hypothetical protein [Bradymonadales bacterium]